MRPLFRRISLLLAITGAALAILTSPSKSSAQTHPALITAAQAVQSPYRHSGRLLVRQGRYGYLGTATYIRRYTGLTAGHMLYNGQTGLATDVRYEPAFFGTSTQEVPVGFFAVLSGYQAAAQSDDASDAAFERDMGYLVFTRPATNNEWALWAANPGTLESAQTCDILGYAAENFDGDALAEIQINAHYQLLRAPGLYESTKYYSEQGMSGGPVYTIFNGGVPQVSAVTVGGTSAPDPAYSDVRAITSTEQKLFLEAEYAQGMVKRGFIKGPRSLARGDTLQFNTGVIFVDGLKERSDFTTFYDEASLVATGPLKKKVVIARYAYGAYTVALSPDFPVGQTVSLELLRNTIAKKGQIPLTTFQIKTQ